MKAQAIILAVALCFVAAELSFAADANLGTWKLHAAKSEFSPGSPKNETVVYEAAGDNIKVTVDGTDKDGKPTYNEWTGKFDGKDYPVTGDPNSDERSYTKIDDRTLGFNFKKGGKGTASGRIAVSIYSNSGTVPSSCFSATGKTVTS